MTGFSGFPPGTRSVPVPAPLLGPLLEQITDEAELKCTLRFVWHVAQVRGQPRAVRASELGQDGVLLAALGSPEAIARGLRLAVERGTLLVASPDGAEAAYMLHTPENQRAAALMRPAPKGTPAPLEGVFPESPGPPAERPNIFVLYEENIGAVAQLVADELKDAEATYPYTWIEDAFREAVENNKRNWRYISRILERWAVEGRGHGESGRHPQTLTAAEYLRKYGLPGGRRPRG